MHNEVSRDPIARLGRAATMRVPDAAPSTDLLAGARELFRHHAQAMEALQNRLDDTFITAVQLILHSPGHVVFIGMGKSGHIAQKLAATFASTGTPSFYIHAAEAHHGDLGMITSRDTAILISYSGETTEVVQLLPHLQNRRIPVVALVGRLASTLGRAADAALDISVDREACPHNLAPTTSAITTMAMGHALAVTLMRERDFCPDDFARCHPGGSLGRRLTTQVRHAMRVHDLPMVSPSDTVGEALVTITEGRLGLALVMNGERLVGLVTDGDLRRGMQRHENLLVMPIAEIMTLNPVTIDENVLLDVAHQRMQQMKLKALVAVNSRGRVSGVVEVFNDE